MALTIVLAGCAGNDVRPPSPAQNLSPQELLAEPAPPNERYYVMIFGSQTTPKVPRYVHSWGTVVKVTEHPGAAPTIEQHTIIWMPASLHIRPWHFRVEEGTNLDLHFTIEEMLRNKERVSMWGPYETWRGLYRRFLVQKAFMDSGETGYQCIDTIGEAPRKGTGCDCIHAVSDMDPMFDRSRYALTYFGEAASRNIVRQIRERPILIYPDQTHDWLIPALGLDCHPIVRRHECGPAEEFSPEAVEAYLAKGAGGSCRRGLLRR
jgi:hypothetical protein